MLGYAPSALILIGALILVPERSKGAEPRPVAPLAGVDARTLSVRIDELVGQRLRNEGIPAASLADDAEFLRRLSLDLNGRIPSVKQLMDFLDDTRPDKRRRWIDELLEGQDNAPRYVQHFARYWCRQILAQTPQTFDAIVAPLEGRLQKQVKANTPYDRLFRELLTEPEAVGFFVANENKPENLASRTSRLFLGVRLECAQCHDDRSGGKWTRAQFWELAAFFTGLPDPAGVNEIVALPQSQKGAAPRIRVGDSNTWVEARFPDGKQPQWQAAVTPRRLLAEWIVRSDNPWFARAMVNRLWHYFFGTGLVDPVDGLGIESNSPSHPELLDELVGQFVAHRFDAKYLIQAITGSQTYQRSSRQTHPGQSDPRLFARAASRALTREQLYESLVLATGYHPDRTRSGAASFRGEFLGPFHDPNSQPVDFQASIQQALMMMNGKFTEEATHSARSTTVATVIDSKRPTTLAVRIEELYLLTLSRKPRREETVRLVEFAAHKDNKQALQDILWALLNSTESVLNH